ncbi:hypothetical protein HO133_000007 [Letharia lupina]|uniref:Uncharacterized protein n=1 Tax=Letharia lupina TaxID=560253 RepID=A0A8H6FLJ6_9LECA|nr:uncharacterized protein HO133_000007 [Letharia lupina]KAF6230748.1 hypothetical protein HO133_000007 [Letharia lupina]
MAPPAYQKKTIGETSGELVPSTSHQAVNTPNPQPMISDLSQDTINGLMTAFGEIQRFEQRLERIEQFLGPALYQNPTSSPNPTSPLNATSLPSIEIPQQKLSHTYDSSYHTNPGHLRAEEMGYFDLQQANVEKTAEKSTEKITEKNKSASSSSVIQAGTVSMIPHQATMYNCGKPSPRLNSAPLSTLPLASLLASLLISQLASQLASPLGYIRFAKDMEAIGQG